MSKSEIMPPQLTSHDHVLPLVYASIAAGTSNLTPAILVKVNGDNNLENFRRDDQTWKVRLIEEDFHRLMWDCQDV